MIRPLLALALGMGLMAPKAGQAQTQTVDPPGTSGIMAQYRAWFAAVDTNKDGFLDKEELAVAFRGARAKPFDYVPPPKEPKDGKDKDEKDKDAKDKDEKDKPAKDKDEKDKDEKDRSEKDKSSSTKPDKKPDYSRYPDYNFLVQLDVNNDEMISKEEFDNWARDLAVQIKNQLETQQRMLSLQNQLQGGTKLKPDQRRRLEAELKREQQQMNNFQAKLLKLEKHIKQSQKPVTRR